MTPYIFNAHSGNVPSMGDRTKAPSQPRALVTHRHEEVVVSRRHRQLTRDVVHPRFNLCSQTIGDEERLPVAVGAREGEGSE
ncbi:MAG TPA: hypothetical protein VMU55_08295 [Solirubrobacteraceae bacterium]|nr:hypothetical protein [Solirubrobacteraceae bacterium]